MKIKSEITYGNNMTNLDEWQQKAHPWTVTLKNGRKRMTVPFFTGQALGEPTTSDVLWCLISDASGVCDGFDWFCDCYGYDKDSRTAERIFNQCKQIKSKLERFFGNSCGSVLAMDEGEVNELCQ
jgi:hypothetical protein